MTPPSSAEDELGALMHAAQRGDATAYHQLLCTVTPRIRRIVARQRVFSSTEDVEDLVQDVLLSLHAVRATYDPSRPFMPWLLAIISNRLADGARRYARQTAREIHGDDPAVTFADRPTNTNHERFEAREVLEQAIRSLPRGQREAIELLKLRELSLKEASAASGLSIGALKVATHRAMIALRRTLHRTGRDED
jgi:RNA polymerase sigma factor (sigma-70 family)